jgi:hypothetical protein
MTFQHSSLSLESVVLYPNYYQMHGIRRAVQLLAPPLKSTNRYSSG